MKVLVLAVSILLSTTIAASAACQRTLPKERTGYWKYSIVNGHKCWYNSSRRGKRIKANRKRVEEVATPIAPPVPLPAERPVDIPTSTFEELWKVRGVKG